MVLPNLLVREALRSPFTTATRELARPCANSTTRVFRRFEHRLVARRMRRSAPAVLLEDRRHWDRGHAVSGCETRAAGFRIRKSMRPAGAKAIVTTGDALRIVTQGR